MAELYSHLPHSRKVRAMYESLGIESMTAPQAVVFFGLLTGLLFGMLAERTKFCLRQSLVGGDRASAAAVWLTALAAAMIGTQIAVGVGLVDFSAHRQFSSRISWLAIAVGGLMFGIGMVLARGCASRLTVLTATGNLRALTVIIVFCIVAHATLKGVLAPVRIWLGNFTADLAGAEVIPGAPALWAVLAAGLSAMAVWRGRPGVGYVFGAICLGLLVPLAWVGTGLVFYDDFDPVPLESLSFTAPHADSLFWLIASSAIPAGFGVGLVGGVIAGALVSSLVARTFFWHSFQSAAETGRYIAGAVLMGMGGVLAGGCTVGAGLSGVAGLSTAAMLALLSMVTGALIAARTEAAIRPVPADGGWPTTPPRRPAE